MTRLISNIPIIEERVGFKLDEVLLTPVQSLDSKTRMPLLLERGDSDSYLIVREMERGNLDWNNICKIPVFYYHPYFIYREHKSEKPEVFKDISDIIKRIVDDNLITVEEELAYSIFQKLEKHFTVKVNGVERETKEKCSLYTLKKQDVLSQIYEDKSEKDIKNVAINLLSNSTVNQLLQRYYENGEINKFKLLDQLLQSQNIEAVLVSSPINVQELTGLDIQTIKRNDILGICPTNEEKIYIISSHTISTNVFDKPHIEFDNRKDAILHVAKGLIFGIEEDFLGTGTLQIIQENNVQIRTISNLLRIWREKIVWGDLAYFIIAGQACNYAINGALQFVEKSLHKNLVLTEKEIEKKYFQLLHLFIEENKIPLQIRPYMTNIHAGKRTLYPSRPVEYLLDESIKSLKIDAGIFLIDHHNLIRACSDIARTLVYGKEGKEVYNIIQQEMFKLIQTIKVGDTGEEIYNRCIQSLSKHESFIKKLNMMPSNFVFHIGYDRDIGHLLERQESFSFGFSRGEQKRIEEGMIGCVEIHWPYDEYGMTIEDMFIVNCGGAIPLSR